MACAPGTIFRNYLVPVTRSDGQVQTGQTRDAQINNLGDVEQLLDNSKHKYFKVQNGYVLSNGDNLQRLNEVLTTFDRDALLSALRIG